MILPSLKGFAPVLALAALAGCSTTDIVGSRAQELPNPPSIIEEHTDASLEDVNEKIQAAYQQLFFGEPTKEAIYRDQGDGTAYIEDIFNGDVRTDSIGYGMLVTVQLGEQEPFDKIWSWAKKYMLVDSGPARGQLDWNCSTQGDDCIHTAATDSSSLIVTALFLAATKFQEQDTHDYNADALSLLDAMSHIEERNGGVVGGVGNCFDGIAQLPRRTSTSFDKNVPVNYLMPAFYDFWAERQPNRAEYWRGIANRSREILEEVPEAKTGLIPETVTFEGERVLGFDNYINITSRTLLNVTLDQTWHQPGGWIATNNERLLDFFLSIGIEDYVAEYYSNGLPYNGFNTLAHRSLVALAAGTSRKPEHDAFLEDLLVQEIPTGQFRYYDGLLYLLALIVLSGQMPSP